MNVTETEIVRNKDDSIDPLTCVRETAQFYFNERDADSTILKQRRNVFGCHVRNTDVASVEQRWRHV